MLCRMIPVCFWLRGGRAVATGTEGEGGIAVPVLSAWDSTVFSRVGQKRIYNIYGYIYGVYTITLAGKSPNILSYTVYIYQLCISFLMLMLVSLCHHSGVGLGLG